MMVARSFVAGMLVGMFAAFPAWSDEGGRRSDGGSPNNGRGDGGSSNNGRGGRGRHHHHHHGHSHHRTTSFIFPFAYSTPFIWGTQGYYDPFFVEQNQFAYEFQRQQARLEAERAVQADAEARAAAAERLALLKAEARRKRSAEAARLAARNFSARNYRNAAVNYQEAAALATDDASALLMLAQSQFALKKYLDAAQSLRGAIRINPNMVDLDVMSLYGDADDFRQQLTSLADELRVNPLNRDAMLLLGHMLYVSGQKAKAKTILLESAKLGVEAETLKPYLDFFQPPITPAR
jgi:hypothetical protein